MTWHLLSGEFPPDCGGVGDYTADLARALEAAGDRVHIWTPLHTLPDRFGRASRERLADALQETPGIVLLQYVPNALGARGMNLRFCLWLRTLASKGVDVRVMFHEPYFYYSLSRPWRNALAVAQRVMAAVLLQASGTTYLSTDTWRRYLTSTGGGDRFRTLPIPSSVPAAGLPASIAKWRHAFAPAGEPVVGHFGTYGEHVAGELFQLLPIVGAQSPRARFAFIGAGSAEFLERLERRDARLAARSRATGRLDGRETASALRACDLMIQPYPDGITTRRTSAMAGLRNSVATVSTVGALTEPIWAESQAVALAPSGDTARFAELVSSLLKDPAARDGFARRGSRTYEGRFAIEHTIAALRAAPAAAA
jgi:glycosyltransferase involved in cell wall biosynthesis